MCHQAKPEKLVLGSVELESDLSGLIPKPCPSQRHPFSWVPERCPDGLDQLLGIRSLREDLWLIPLLPHSLLPPWKRVI